MRAGPLLRHGSVYAVGDVLERIIGLAMLPVYAYALTLADFGLFALVQAVTGLGGALLGLGMYPTLVRFLHNPDPGSTPRQVVGAAWLVLLVVPFAVLGATALASRPIFATLTPSLPVAPLALLALLIVYCNVGFIEAELALTRARTQPWRYAFVMVGRAALTALLAIWLVVVQKHGALGAVLAQAIASICVAVVCALLLYRDADVEWNPVLGKRLLRFGLPLVPQSASSWAMRLQDRMILDQFVPLSAIGAYAMSYRMATPLTIFMGSGLRVAMPMLSRAGSEAALRRETGAVISRYLLVSVCVCLLGTLVVLDAVAVMLPEAYSSAGPLAQVVLPATLALGIFQVSSYASTLYAGRRLPVVALTVASAVLNMGLNYTLIPSYGVWGAAWSALASSIVLAAASIFFSPLPALLREFVSTLVLVFTVAGGLLALLLVIDFDSAWQRVGSALVATAATSALAFWRVRRDSSGIAVAAGNA